MSRCASVLSKLAAAALIFGTCLSLSVPAHADKRVALVIGNSAYKSVGPLDNPKNDATLMAETLRSLGFTLVGGGAQLDLDKSGIDRVVQNFGHLLPGADVGLFYYAGHAVEVGGVNYLAPVDANLTRESDLDFQMLDANLVLRQMADAGTKLNVVILDACRNNPFISRGLRATGGGLAQMQAPEGTLIAYATQPGNVAKDGADGNSPFTKALARTIKRPGLGIFDAFNEVGLLVMQVTGNAQQPWYSTSPIRGHFCFAGAPACGSPTVAEEPNANTKEARLTDSGESLRLVQAGRVAVAQKDYGAARQFFEQASSMGSTTAMTNLGSMYANGWIVSKDYTQPRQWLERAAAAGESFAMVSLGIFYENGWALPKDYNQARQWFEKSAAAGNTSAMNNLGALYQNGLGVGQDYAQARKWYEEAEAGHNTLAMTNLGYLYQDGLGVTKDYAQARRRYETAAAAGQPEAMTNLGFLYANGLGVAKDYTVARQWYEKGAAAGNPVGMNNLGAFYQNGWGASKDYTQARQWYEKAAAAGNALALNNLGWFYQNGLGVTKDYVQARQWYEKAATAGNSDGMNSLGWFYHNGWGVTQDYTQARQWYEKAAAAGNALAMNNLGVVYGTGLGVPKDYAQARQWYKKAAAAGNELAKDNLRKLDRKK